MAEKSTLVKSSTTGLGVYYVFNMFCSHSVSVYHVALGKQDKCASYHPSYFPRGTKGVFKY